MYAAGHHNAEPGLLTTARNPTRRKLEWIALFAAVVIGGASAFFLSTNSTARSTDEAKKNAAPMTLEFVPNNIATVALQPLVRTSAISGSWSPLSEAIVRATVADEVHSTSMCSRWRAASWPNMRSSWARGLMSAA